MSKHNVVHLHAGKEKILLAEQSVIASIIFDPTCLPIVESILTAKDFIHPQHIHIFKTFQALVDDNTDINLVSVTEHLHRIGKLDAVGGPVYLADLGDNIGSARQVEYYAKMVREASVSRKYYEVCKGLQIEAEQVADGKSRLHDILEAHESKLFELSREYYKSHNINNIGAVVVEEMQRLEAIFENGKTDGIMSGYFDLDKITNGFQPGELIYLAARPGVGKTGLALNIANNCGVPVGFFSLEMSSSELAKRQISLISGVDGWNLRTLTLSGEQWSAIMQASNAINELPVYIDDKPSLSIQELRSKSRQLVSKYGVKMIIVDYLQIMGVNKGRSREQEISNISGQLKAMAKELSIPVLCLAQLNREVEKRDNKKPKLSDLRESGSLEQDADMVLFLWPVTDSDMEINFSVAKNRNGRTGEGKLIYNKAVQKFYDWES